MDKKHARVKQTQQLYKDNVKITCKKALNVKEQISDIIKDTVIVTKIQGNEMEDEIAIDSAPELEEAMIPDEKQIADEYEALIKKQLQVLQADERGKQALQNEIAEIRNQQEKRAEALRVRAKALEVEKIRSKKIASRPPPLPQSVKLLLKEQAIKESALSSVQANSNLSMVDEVFEEEEDDSEDKENLDENYHEERRRMQEVWDMKAKKRFHEALKKDRQKQEHAEILKEIENAEKLNRRQLARNVSEPEGKLPCHLPDKLHHAEKQVAMEDAVEGIFKLKKPSKEHAVEDLEGYEDKWEAKYKQIDSVVESKMIDCVPSFVKENYSYLLQEEPTYRCSKRFTGLNISMDDLNTAYIESPPADITSTSEEIDAVISHLDQMRSELNEAYEKEFKPLLEAEGAPKVASSDKAVETHILKLPTEDKAVEINSRMSPKEKVTSSSRSVQVDILQGGLLSYKRRDLGSMFKSHANDSASYLPHLSTTPADLISPEMVKSSNGVQSWSSSSYWSLPSKHGLPNICRFCDSPTCTIPLVEGEQFHKDCIPLAEGIKKQLDDSNSRSAPIAEVSEEESNKFVTPSNEQLPSNSIKSKFASYVKLVADKYLKNKPATESLGTQERTSQTSDDHFSNSIAYSKTEVTVQKEPSISVKTTVETDISKVQPDSPEKSVHIKQREAEVEDVPKTDNSEKGREPEFEQSVHNIIDDPKSFRKISLVINMDNSADNDLLQKCHEIITTNLANIFSANGNRSPSAVVCDPTEPSSNLQEVAEQHEVDSLTGYVYHDLSTIPEMDSALTNDTAHSGTPGSFLNVSKKTSLPDAKESENISPEEIDTTSTSLVDAPVSEVSELAKNIRFVTSPPLEPDQLSTDVPKDQTPLISGTVTAIQTPHGVAGQKAVDVDKTQSVQFFPMEQTKNHSTPKTSDNSSGSYSVLTTPSWSSLQTSTSKDSQTMPYSSSFRDSKSSHSHLTSTSSLPRYFKDVSSIKQNGSSTSKSEDLSSSKTPSGKSGESTTKQGMDAPGFRIEPTSPQIRVGKQFELQESSSSSFKPMTPLSYLSTPSETYPKCKAVEDKDGNSRENVDFSRHSFSQNKSVSEGFQSAGSSFDSFKPMTQCSYFSSLNETNLKHKSANGKHYSPRKGGHRMIPYYLSQINASSEERIDKGSFSSFRPMQLQSDVSSPEETSVQYKTIVSKENNAPVLCGSNIDYQSENTGGSNFQSMSSHLYFSSPGDVSAANSNRLSPKKEASFNLKLKVQNPLRISLSESTSSQNTGQGTSSDIPGVVTYPVQLRFGVEPDQFFNPLKGLENNVGDGFHVQQELSAEDLSKCDPYVRQKLYMMSNKALLKSSPDKKTCDSVDFDANVEQPKKDTRAMKVFSSGFVPHLTPADFASCKNIEKDDNEKNWTSSAANISSEKVAEISKVQLTDLHSRNSKELLLLNSPNPILEALKQQFALRPSPKVCTPSATPSSCSSSENLSEMFAESKITYQSTPIKSIEEIIQETGILDEPDLTLMNTELTIKPDSPEHPRLLSEDCSLKNDVFNTPSGIDSGDLTLRQYTTPTGSAVSSSPYSCDSPSMISFLQHEQSCLASSNAGGSQQCVQKNSKFDYKKRTKRLWSNLEEVRNRRLMEEKKEQIAKNRLKMKSYTKKFVTPKKKAT